MLVGQLDFESPPVAVDGVVYVNALESGGTTYALDEATGNIIWTQDTFDGSEGTVAYWWGVVYEAEACDQVTAWLGIDGTQLWYHSSGCTGGGGAAPVVYRDKIYVRDWAQGNIVLDFAGNALGGFSGAVPPAFEDGIGYFLD